MSGYSAMPPPPTSAGYGQPHRGPAPSTVVNAVRTMFALVVLSLIGLVLLFVDKDALRRAIRNANSTFDTKQLDDAVHTALTVGVAFAVVLIVLYVLLALQVRRGKNWARVVAWVFSGLGALGAISNLAGSQAASTKILAAIELVLFLALIVLLALKPSNDYFRRTA